MFKELIHKIYNQDGWFGNYVYKLAKAVLHFNVPTIKTIYTPLLLLRQLVRNCWIFIVQKFLNEPMFKVRCENVGRGLKLDKGFPYIAPNLVLKLGHNVHIDGKNTFAAASLNPAPELRIGNNSSIGYGSTISVAERVEIGSNCLISFNVFICDNNGHPLEPERRHEKISPHDISPIVISDNVWIGAGAFIGKGVTIGEGSVVGANAFVFQSIPAGSVVSGNPGKVIKTFDMRYSQ